MVLFPARVAAASLGIHVALDARRTQLMRSALGRPLVRLTSGSIIGVALGMLVCQFFPQIVYQATSPRSAGVGRRGRDNGADRACRRLDSGAACAERRSGAVAARGVS